VVAAYTVFTVDDFYFLEDQSARNTLLIQHKAIDGDACVLADCYAYYSLWWFKNFDNIVIGGPKLAVTFKGTHPGLANCDDQYSAQFQISKYRGLSDEQAGDNADDCKENNGLLRMLIDDGSNVGNAASIVTGSSRVEDIEAAIGRIGRNSEPGDQLTLFLFGHGSSTFGDAKFNNVGPDMTGRDLAAMLDVLSGVDIVVFNTTSASFEFSRELSVMGRVVVSATRSAAERYDPLFGGFLVTAVQQKRADIDRNGRVSVLEVFNYASGQIAQWYRDQDRLSTENAVLDDSGDGLFTREPGTGQPDGLLAEIAYLDVISAATQKTSSGALRIAAEMQTIEREIFILRNQKVNYLEEDYWNRLEALLIDLATRTRRYNELP
jgi:hypothetical protein